MESINVTAVRPSQDRLLRDDDRTARKLVPSDADLRTLAGLEVDPATIANDGFDYSKTVVRKPWGYEYLLFENELVAVWILHIKESHETSLHCHPRKHTAVMVLSGAARCSVLEGDIVRRAAESMVIGKGVFHRTRSISPGGTIVMEVESPVNKRDLVRFQDQYGREGMGYERADQFSFNLQNYNYTSFIDPKIYYNARKRFGTCSIQLVECGSAEELRQLIHATEWTALTLLRGRLAVPGVDAPLGPGDVVGHAALREACGISTEGRLEALILNQSDTLTRLSDFVIAHLKSRGLRDVFFVPGTTNAHLIDAVGRDTEMRSLALQTEHGATLAAEGYAKLTGRPGVVLLSSDPAATQALAGVANAWIDSTPMLIVSGQPRPSDLGAPREQSSASAGQVPAYPVDTPLRQLANKELDVVRLVQTVTKHAAVVSDPLLVRGALDEAHRVSIAGRAGPAWLDIPIDILGTNIDEADLAPSAPSPESAEGDTSDLRARVCETLALLGRAKRPVLLAGYGVRAASAQAELLDLAAQLSIPVLTSRRGADLVADDHPLFFGRPGTYGQRAANFIIQNSDLLLSIGCRLSLPLIGRNYRAFARGAKKVVVDIDAAELAKPTIEVDLAIKADAGAFVREMLTAGRGVAGFGRADWVARCRLWAERFPPGPDFATGVPVIGVDPYRFVAALSGALDRDDVVVVDGGSSLDFVMQTFRVKSGQRVISSPGLEHRGFALPAAIGAALARRGGRVICLCEKKGLQVTIPELQTIVSRMLPVKAFLFNSKRDDGVRQVQAAYFGARYVGLEGDGIIGSLNMRKLGEAFQIPTATLATEDGLGAAIDAILAASGPVLTGVDLPDGQEVTPRMTFTVTPDGQWRSKPIEDMYPLLDRQVLRDNMIIEVLEDSE